MSQISKRDYETMVDNPDKVILAVANTLGEGYVSSSLMSLHKSKNRVKSQFTFEADKENLYPLTYAFLFIDGNIVANYAIKPVIEDIRAIKALNIEWEI